MAQITFRPVHLGAALALGSVWMGAERLTARAEPVAPRPAVVRMGASTHAARSVWDSVYTAAQATRGDSLYHATCAKCHGDTLSGGTTSTGEDAPPLVGSAFLTNYYGVSVAELYDKIRNGMPPDNPKTIEPAVVVDVMAFLLSKNQFPAGAAELPNDVGKLKEIVIEKSKTP
jgi:mono/diheme cytochrome c family protein